MMYQVSVLIGKLGLRFTPRSRS